MSKRGDLRVVSRQQSLDELPDVLTVEEAARVLRISRGAAYELARQWRVSGGLHGLPVVVLGRSLRVPRAALRQLLEVGGSEVLASGE
jgi:excisionase family DNA binding protein